MKEYIDRSAVMQKFADCVKRSNNSDFAPTPTWNEAVQIVEDAPAADVVDGETYRELLKVAKKMHFWIFLNTDDELGAYDECGLTDEMNALLGYDGQFTVKMDGGVNDG